MKVVLLENVDSLGLPGQVKDVKPGFFRNYLSPRQLAVEGTDTNIRALRSRQKSLESAAARILDEARATADRLADVTLNFTAKVGPSRRLFGSITTGDIAAQLGEKGYEVDRRRITLSEPIKAAGTFNATVRFQGQITASVTIIVEADADSETEPEPQSQLEGDPETESLEASDKASAGSATESEESKTDGSPSEAVSSGDAKPEDDN